MNLTYTVIDIIKSAYSKIGIDADTTETKNIETAHRQLNLMLQLWAANPDMAIQNLVPVTGYANLSDTLEAPPEYCAAMVPNLAIRLASDFDQSPDKLLIADATATIGQITTLNVRRYTGRIPNNGAINKR